MVTDPAATIAEGGLTEISLLDADAREGNPPALQPAKQSDTHAHESTKANRLKQVMISHQVGKGDSKPDTTTKAGRNQSEIARRFLEGSLILYRL